MKHSQNILFTGGRYKEQIDFWKKKLSGVDERFVLRGKPISERTVTTEKRNLDFVLPNSSHETVSKLAKDQALGTFVVLISAFIYLLSRYSQSRVITIATPLLERDNVKTSGADRLYLIEAVDENLTIREWLSRVRETVSQSYRFQNTPLEDISDLNELVAQCGTNILASDARLHRADGGRDEDDLVLWLQTGSSQSAGRFRFNPLHFDESFIGGMERHFQNILKHYTSLETKLRSINLLSEAEFQQVIFEFNDAGAGYPRDKTIHQLFEEQVERTPSNIAVVFDTNSLTYDRLNQKANQLASYLRKSYDLHVDDLVGVMMNRSERMIIALLGVLKAGAAFVPIDPECPKERIDYILENARPRLVLLDSEHIFQLDEFTGHLFAMDAQTEELTAEPITNIPCSNTATDLAYVMYTSGSTGKPKGASAIHRGVVRLVKGTNYVELNSNEVFLQLSPITFDASTFEIWGCLLNGGRLIVMASGRPSLEELETVIAANQVTTLWLTADLFHLIVSERGEALRPIRQLLAGGDVLSTDHVRKFLTEPGRKLINGYGPTECTTFASCYPMTSTTEINGSVSIGRPIGGTQIYLLDRGLHPVPIGVRGEIYIGGDGLARGYLNEPELTAEKFIPNPFSSGERLYKSGDLALHLADGKIEFLGRQDFQVKIRGFRIELGEIEAVLGQHPAVQATVVVVRQESATEKQLVAYVVLNQQPLEGVNELRMFLKGKLPEYMLPSLFIKVYALPMTPNNKVDRGALPEPSQVRAESESIYCAPRNAQEEVLAGIYAQVLHLDRVGIDDNFFALGGDSMRAIQVLSRAFERGMTYSIQQLFEHQTIRQLAAEGMEKGSPAGLSETYPFSLVTADDAMKLPDGLEDAYPLTQLQLGMLFHSEYIPESAVYHDVFSLHIQTRLDSLAFEQSIQHLVDRHPLLRTSFDFTTFSESLQLVHRTASIPIAIKDVSSLTTSEQNELIAELIESEKGQHFEWTQAPLMRMQVHKRSGSGFQFTLSFHHAILDGWSVASMLTELFQVYESQLAGRVVAAEPAMLSSFRDFVALEKESLMSANARQYWTAKLTDANFARLPRWTTSQQANSQPQAGACEVPLSEEISDALRKLARLVTVPLKTVVLAAHLRAMSMLCGQNDILTGLVSHGRPETIDGEKILGLFLNTLPFRQNLLKGTWVDLVQETFLNERELLPYRRYPLARIQKDLGAGSLFETAFNFVHFHVYEGLQHLDELQLLSPSGFEMTNFTFVANFRVDPSYGIRLIFSYDSGQISAEQIKAIGNYYLTILSTMTLEPGRNYESDCFLSPGEQHQILREWNQTAVKYPREQSVTGLFEALAEQHPEALALVHGAEQLSYGELNRRANQLAHYLVQLGVQTERRVWICMERSAQMVVGLLGILKAGGSYVPLDPGYPRERLALMIEGLDEGVILSQKRWRDRLPAHSGRLVLLDVGATEIEKQSPNNLPSVDGGENLAYVIYTSGSTGTPKGVEITHRGLLNLVYWHQRRYEITAASRGTQLAGISFDASVWELWPYLTAGASVHVLDDETRSSTLKLWEWIVANRLTMTFLPTPLAESLLAEDLSGANSLQALLTGGDKLRRYPASGLSFALVNHYGPTESTVVASCAEIAGGDAEGEVPTIGRPIANTEIYITDQYLTPVAVGVTGELHIGGQSLARGYTGRAELTAERFIPNPFSLAGGERLYKTGDLGRYRSNGNIEFLGRKDDQVKIRGYRIELGEVETVLCAHEGVAAAIVVAQEEQRTGGSSKRLVAYVVGSAGAATEPTALNEYLRAKLPEYMVPTAIVMLDSLPLNANGKIDVRALADAHHLRPIPQEFVAPRNSVEESLATIWSQVLGIEKIGVHDNFFELGGDSILSIQVTARAKKAGVYISPKEIFHKGTIAELALIAGARCEMTTEQGLVTGPVHLSPIQEWFFEHTFENHSHWNQVVLLETRKELKAELLEKAVDYLVVHHDSLRLRFVQTELGWQQTSARHGGVLPLIRIDLSALANREVAVAIEKAAADLQASLDLGKGPLLRVALFEVGQDKSGRALILIHHLAVDAVSWRILLEDLETAYQQLDQAELVILPPKTSSFQYWSQQLTLHAQSKELNQELSYWLNESRTRGAHLPIDYRSGENTVASARTLSSSLSKHETQALLQEVPAAFHTQINDVLLTALMLAVGRWIGARTLLIDLEGHGREELFGDVDLSRTVGWFTTLYPVYLDLTNIYAIGDALKTVKEQLRQNPNRGIGYGLLRYLCRDDEVRRQLQTIPQVDVSFNYLGQFDQLFAESALFRIARESSGPTQSPSGTRPHLLEITGSIIEGQLRMNWVYSHNRHRATTIEFLARAFMEQLRNIITDCKKSDAMTFTPSDFPLTNLNQKLLDTVVGKLTETKKESSL